MTISLPKKPTGGDYEDLVAICLIAMGYFIETNLHLRDRTVEILELDIIATPAIDPLSNVVLLDAKAGKSGFSDVFKIFGWMNYLKIGMGCVVRHQPPDEDKREALETVTRATNVHIATVDLEAARFEMECLERVALAVPEALQSAIVTAGWYGRIAQRKCLRAFIDFCKSKSDAVPEIKAATSYRWAIEQAFLAPTPIARARRLYIAYSENRQVTRQLVLMICEGNEETAEREWKKIWDSADRLPFQYSLTMENAARLGIVKNALLHVLAGEDGASAPSAAGSLADLVTPDSFKNALGSMKTHPHRTKLPHLFQLFIEVFGGFYRIEDEDLEYLAQATGIPRAEVVSCLELFNDFFPIQNGWFYTVKDELRVMKMVPAIFRGTGAFLRARLHNVRHYDVIFPKTGWLISKWNNALYKVLEPHLKRPPPI